MIFNIISTKFITLLLAVDITSTTAGNLRSRKATTSLFDSTHREALLRGSSSFDILSSEDDEEEEAEPSEYLIDEAATKAAEANTVIASASGLEMGSDADVAATQEAIYVDGEEESGSSMYAPTEGATTSSEETITADKDEYEDSDNVSFTFTIAKEPQELSNYKIGIFMRMANVQGGSLEPIVSLPLCSDGSCIFTDDMTKGSVTFNEDLNEDPDGTGRLTSMQWPIDLYQWGTGFDAYILDENGDDVVGPVKFIIKMDDA